jgi:outer membrane receptor protein involved in Fe transport
MGGVIQVLTLDAGADSPFAAEATLRFASADLSYGTSINTTGTVGSFSYLFGGSINQHGTLRSGGGEDQPVSDYATSYWRAKLGWDLGTFHLSTAYFGTLIQDAGRADNLGKGELHIYDNNDHLAYLRAGYKGGAKLLSVIATLSYHGLNEQVERYNCKRSTNDDGTQSVTDRARCVALDESTLEKKQRNEDKVHSVGADLNAQMAFWNARLLVNSGAEFYQDFVDSNRKDAKAADGFEFKASDRGNFSNGSTYQSSGVFLHLEGTALEYKPAALELRLTSGVRFSHFSVHAPLVPDLGDVDYTFSGFVASGGLQLLIPERYNLYASFVQGFRAPNLQESTVLGHTGSKFEVPNPALKPERSDTIEVGTRVRLGPVDLSAAWFYSMLHNVIDEKEALFQGEPTLADGTPVVQRVNTAEGLYQGVEAFASVIFWRLRLSAGATWMTGNLTDGDGRTTPARRVPPLFGTASLKYTHPGNIGYVELFTRWAGAQDELHPSDLKDLRICETAPYSGVTHQDLGQSCKGTPGYAVLGARAGWKFTEQMRADLSLNNLADSKYKVHGSGYPGPGLDARLTLSGNF